jgi:cytidine deaminase
MNDRELIKKALQARKNAHAPYSRFLVGAVLLAANDRIYTGANVENASYGLTVCAERVAIFQAVAQGQRRFRKLVIATDTETPKSLCGACLQVLSEFEEDLQIICATVSGKTTSYRLKELLPNPFKKMSKGL